MDVSTDLSRLVFKLRIAQRAAWTRGERVLVESYLQQHPELAGHEESMLDFIYSEYCLREDLGEKPDATEYADRFPQWAAPLQSLLDLHQAIDQTEQASASLLDAGTSLGVVTCPSNIPKYIGRYRVERILGHGGFCLVYLAHDDQLKRCVAIKVLHARLVAQAAQVEAYLAEARNVAHLDHPHIVPVLDVGSTDEFPYFVVSKYIDGTDLATKLRQASLPIRKTVELIATVAEALQHAHLQGLVHRDIKPENILLDKHVQPYVADFGLALRAQDIGKGSRFAGTPVYMSPEQARGEGHRVDGRSDIFSLGVVFYEMLTGQRPFKADSQLELLEQINKVEIQPPRQVNDRIPKELDRICLKAMSKRTSDRYATAMDLANDLKCFLAESQAVNPSNRMGLLLSETEITTPISTSTTPPTSDCQPIRIVPKGLRSFDAQDADFFLELLPGPRDRNGVPESIRFWKSRLEETDVDNTFSVGLIYGPSGCGKSSLVRAGILPRLTDSVIAIYVEATAEETETQLLYQLRKRCSALSDSASLKGTLAALRCGQGVALGKKIVIILDQFEQWLHAHKHEQGTKLVQALRHCDGGRVQCVLMVRDDFWMAVTRFMRELEVPLLEGQNSAAVDLFDLDHARKVLREFGRAFGKLPENFADKSDDQKKLLTDAISGLAQDGKVISVRLALFGEMMKGRSWTPSVLKEGGGTEGIGVSFLDETFNAATTSPVHHYHHKAASNVLAALLPESGSNIKGHMRSYDELVKASGYESRPRDFHELIRILDSELRLITPTDHDGLYSQAILPLTPQPPLPEDGARGSKEIRALTPPMTGEITRYYQLTHDYLVPSLRDWLTRKQKETRRGRAELLLADRAAVWNARPEIRQLPSLIEWLKIQWWSPKKNWTVPQQKMMSKASGYYASRAMLAASMLTLIGWGSYEIHAIQQAHILRDRLLVANTSEVPNIVDEMASYRRWLDPLLRVSLNDAETNNDQRTQLHASLALFPVEAKQVDNLYARLLDSEPHDVPVIRDALLPHKGFIIDKLWRALESPSKNTERLRAAAALATYDSESERWADAQVAIANDLVNVPTVYLGQWLEMLRPVRFKLLAALSDVFRNVNCRDTERSLATDILADYAADQPQLLAELAMDAEERQFTVIYQKLEKQAGRVISIFTSELLKSLQPKWDDPPLDPSWSQPDSSVKRIFELANGVVEERFAFTQSMSISDFVFVAEALRESGYRPFRVRPYSVEEATFVAAVWTRDGKEWHMATDLTKEEMSAHGEELKAKGYFPEDVAGYGTVELQFAAVWVAGDIAAANRHLFVGIPKAEHQIELDRLNQTLVPLTLQWHQGTNGELTVNQVFGKSEVKDWEQRSVRDQTAFEALAAKGSLVDISVLEGTPKSLLYSTIRHEVPSRTGQHYYGIDEHEHLTRSRALAEKDYRMVSIAVIRGDVNAPATTASVWHRPSVSEAAKETLAKRQAHAGVALLKMGQAEMVWPLLKHSPDPRVRSYLIHRFSRLGVDANTIINRFDDEMDVTIQTALLMSLGEYDENKLPIQNRERLFPRLQEIYRTATDPGLHASSEWLLRQWNKEEWIKEVNEEWANNVEQRAKRLESIGMVLAKESEKAPPQWFVNSQGQTMVVIPGPVQFVVGSPISEVGRFTSEAQRKKRIGRIFAIGTKLVTLEQYRQFNQGIRGFGRNLPTPDCPVTYVNWYDATNYCNWLSKVEGIPEDQWSYESNGDVIQLKANYLNLSGYRLPSQAEMEYATRAGALTSRYYGETEELLPEYAWCLKNSQDHTWPVGSLKPNDLGLFDVHGNAHTWCQESILLAEDSTDDVEDQLDVKNTVQRMLRGGSYGTQLYNVRSASRSAQLPTFQSVYNGFRVARTLLPISTTDSPVNRGDERNISSHR